ncbi:MAG: flagellar export chaperone FliS [Deltaproteobacteria bacterium]|nr:flagellar export chaperone FliS [Deltaproteobacteria bacterium]
MSNNYGLNKYKTTSVTTASRGQVLLMLYEGAMKFCRIAIEATKRKDLAEKGKNILKIQDIINELVVTLNHDVGGDLSRELERLYNYMIEQITVANVKNDPKPLETVLKLLETLHEGWVAAVNQVGKSGGDAFAAAAAEKSNPTTVNMAPPGANKPKPTGGK